MTTVAQAMMLTSGLFVNLPMIRLSLMSNSMRMSTIGSSAPFSTCDQKMMPSSGACGISTTAAPTTIKPAYKP